ncbi:MAG: TetR/AcrR family transcriptional regulator [Ferrovibrio sp.]|jgi:TetR/AcrR family transcriptional repressor of lmrAB and yxaGH operons|uniref:TetR/AcrR family transcriptional regulator n=1 Tax=Ferrovibrio sp. TaxID=1917215 RepID=UPI00391A549A
MVRSAAAAKPTRLSARDRFVEMTAKLMSRRGYAGTGLNEIVEKSGAPKGSLYHYFPDGKEQLAAAAVTWASARFMATLRDELVGSATVAEAMGNLAETIAGWLEASKFRDGSPLTIVAVETGPFIEPLRLACDVGYRDWGDTIAEALRAEGRKPAEAADLALLAVTSLEGAVILARTRHSAEPLRQIGRLLKRSLK